MSTQFNTLQSIKRRFFAMRNGITADTLRRAGDHHRIIFGLNLPQIAEIAADYRGDTDLAVQLWANDTTRESRLAAPMILDPSDTPHDKAMQMALEARGSEETDILCHRLLRRLPYAAEMLHELVSQQGASYLTLRLTMNMLPAQADTARSLLAAIPADAPHDVRLLAARLADEVEFLDEGI